MKKILIFIAVSFGFVTVTVSIFSRLSTQVKPGIEVLRDDRFKALEGKRVGLITNPTGVDRNLKSTADILFEAPNVNLVALYGPEHGIRGDVTAGGSIDDITDSQTGLPVYSLYGKNRKPSSEILQGIDVLVYDIQDIGCRSYTYISTMGLAMEAAAENGIEFVVLDRPNPLGGEKFEGCPNVEPNLVSFVSQFPVTYIHGFTTGELAGFLNGEGLLKDGIRCKLKVIRMKGWERKMNFKATGLPWVISSPHIPRSETAYFYASSGILGELYFFNIGIGYTLPFELFAAEWMDAEKLTANLNGLKIPGVRFRPIHYKPYYGSQKDIYLHGVQTYIIDVNKIPLTLIQFYVLQECHKLYPDKNAFELCGPERLSMFDKVCGSGRMREVFSQSFTVDSILTVWNNDVDNFKKKAKKYFIYK